MRDAAGKAARLLRGVGAGLAGLAAGLAMTVSAEAQDTRGEVAEARARAFERLYAAPQDRRAMLDYARLSVAARDYEAASSVLERLVALEPGNAEARLQLAIAYFALGSDAQASRQLTLLQAQPGVDPALSARAADYGRAADARNRVNSVSGVARLGTGWASDPDSANLEAGVTLTWRRDLGPKQDWVTRLAMFGSLPDASDRQTAYRFDLRTGPEFRPADTAIGLRLQPYAGLSRSRDSFGARRESEGVGLLVQRPLGQRAMILADLGFQSVTRDDGGPSGEGAVIDLLAQYRIGERVTLRGRLRHEALEEDGRDERERLAMVEVVHDLGVDPFGAGRNLQGTLALGWQEAERRQGGTVSRETEFASLTLRGYVDATRFVDMSLGRSERDAGFGSSARNVDWVSIRLGWEF
ncbi:tetratricopeptide repeat protein [Cereibacter changlensis]|uniref:Tetratricopeptide repeat protein n=1 Tax=Cereibacter changlensis TaxID=402884 RepID=A0A4U0Z713_9RHOB|nr:tetratricopeptide repeat protein [Cereibacter changlensis]TKA98354.1 tetratricopeptide repeat protein [Cereibacter changlensis]